MKKENKNIFSVGAWEIALVMVVLLLVAFFQGVRNDADAENVAGEGGRVLRTVQKADTSSGDERAGIAVTKEEPVQSPPSTGKVSLHFNPMDRSGMVAAVTVEFGATLDQIDSYVEEDSGDFVRIMKGTTTADIKFVGDGGTNVIVPKGTNYVAFGVEASTSIGGTGGGMGIIQLKDDMTEEDWEKLDAALDQMEMLLKAENTGKERQDVAGGNSASPDAGGLGPGAVDSEEVEEYAVPIGTFADFKKPGGSSYSTSRNSRSDANADWNTLKGNSNVKDEKSIEGSDINF